jgi:hypothetical protein
MKHIALEELNFLWELTDVEEVEKMWNMGIPITFIADNFERDIDEVALLIMDRVRAGIIQPRKGGVFGRAYHDK